MPQYTAEAPPFLWRSVYHLRQHQANRGISLCYLCPPGALAEATA
jgi:hypothetical protein